ncbi:IclR family transcriptional regulator [Dongia sp.]|jgi:IclR family acetate operon transcriptional repressor|uniref:IclR family transcriptional regulator n=1 Tax=Dongia sp. TaxID=1977262 RepID=UPI0035B1FBE8
MQEVNPTAVETKPDERYRVQSLGRALDLLELLAKAGRDGGRLTDLALGLGLSKAATYAILQTYLSRGFISALGEGPTKRYRLGMSLARFGDLAIANIALADMAMPILRALTRELGLTSRVAILDEGYAVVVGRADAPGAVRFDAALGRRELPHSSAVGKAMLAAMPRAQALTILRNVGLPRRTPHTLTTMPAIQDDLDRVVAHGYAIDDEEDTEGVVCIGTCVFDRTGNAVGAISVTGLKQNSSEDKQEQLAATLMRHADQLSRHMGGIDGADAWALRRVA